MSEKNKIEGEGSYEGARRYQESIKDFMESGQIEKKAREAADMSEEEQAESAKAEALGKAHIQEEDPEVKEPLSKP